MVGTDKILARKEGNVGYLIFNNPARHNAMSLEMWSAVAEVVKEYSADNSVRVLVLTGAGGKAFVSGADISEFDKVRSNEDAVAHYAAVTEGVSSAVYDFGKPTIAMINGYCLGGGLGLATCCDLRICSDNSVFAVPAGKLGVGYAYAGIKRLSDIVGPSFAKEIFYTARKFNAAEALQMGLVNRVVPAGELEGYISDYANTIAGNAPLTIAAAKYAINQVLVDESTRDLAGTDAAVKRCFQSKDYKEGRTAFMEKRKPQFTGT